MLLFLLTLLLGYALLSEILLQAEFRSEEETQLSLRLSGVGFSRRWHFLMRRTEQGRQFFLKDEHGLHSLSSGGQHVNWLRLLNTLLHQPVRLKRFLMRRMHIDQLYLLILLHTEDAANTALFSCLLQGLFTLPPCRRDQIRIQVLPAFFRPRSSVQARCIIRARLGTIILTAGLLLLTHLTEQTRTESEAMPHGTSHR